MFLIVLKAVFYFLPAYVANMVPIFLARFKVWEFLNVPVDFNRKYSDGTPLVGVTKTWRGIIGGILGSMLIVLIQYFIQKYGFWNQVFLFEYSLHSILILGIYFGLGECFGDVIKSFFKRRLKIQSSAPFFPFDQLSFLGALGLSLLYFVPEFGIILAILILSPLVPICANLVGFKLGLKKVWW